MGFVSSDATLELALAIAGRDVDRARKALAENANPNERIIPSVGWVGSALSFLLKQILLPNPDPHWSPMARLLLEPGSGVSLESQASFVRQCMKRWGEAGLDWALEAGVSKPALLERVSVMGVETSLFDAALRFGEEKLAQRLWDEFGVSPSPAGDCIATRSSSLVAACHPSAQLATRQSALWFRLLALPWPQEDLDHALRRSVLLGSPVLIRQLLDRKANPNSVGQEGEALPPLVQCLGALGANRSREVVLALGASGANIEEKVDFSISFLGGVQNLCVSKDTSTPTEPTEHHGATPLGLACATVNREGFLDLMELGANLSHQTREGNTPFHLLALSRWSERLPLFEVPSHCLVDDLLNANASVLMRNKDGLTPLEVWLSQPWRVDVEMVPSAPSTARRWVWATLDADLSLLGPVSSLLLKQPREHPLFGAMVDAINSWGMRGRLEVTVGQPHPTASSRPRM